MCLCSLADVSFIYFLICPGRGTGEAETGAGGFAPGAGRAESQTRADAA